MKNRLSVLLLTAVLIVGLVGTVNAVEQKTAEISYPQTPRELMIKSEIYQNLKEECGKIDLSRYELLVAEAEELVSEVLEETGIGKTQTPQITLSEQDGIVTSLLVEYSQDGFELMSTEEFDREVERILSKIDPSMSDVEKALVVNDYIAANYCYDLTYSIYTKEELFEQKTGVCQAYAEAYQYILKDKLGINCVMVTSDSMNHAWNMVEIDGEWYHVDTTWNDPVPDQPGRAMHEYFLLNDAEISDEEHQHEGWVGGEKSESTRFSNAFWSDIDVEIIIYDGGYYYITDDGVIIRRDVDTDSETTIYEVDDIWYVWDKPGYYWQGKFSSIAYCDEVLYVNTATEILAMSMDGKNVRSVVQCDTSAGYIWGLLLSGNKIEYFVSRSLPDYGIESYEQFRFRGIRGDIDGDGLVDIRDALLLFNHSMMPEIYPIDYFEGVDFTKDGSFDVRDAILLLNYSVLPELFPIG